MPPAKFPVFIDTDIGDDIDDALALALVANSPEVALQGVTTVFGDTQARARLAAHLLNVFQHAPLPIAAGLGTPMQPRKQPSGAHQAAILDPTHDYPLSKLSAPDLLIETALAHFGQLTLLTLGPLTNVATALRKEPRLFMALRRIIMMGGTSGLPWAEWNVRQDAQAAQIVLAAGIPITLIGLNATWRCHLRDQDLTQLRRLGTPQTKLLCELITIWQRHRPRWQPAYPYLHDPLTVVALCRPELLSFTEMTVRVPTLGLLQGMMIPRLLNGPLVHAAVKLHADQARDWIMQRLMQPATSSSDGQAQSTNLGDDIRQD